MKTHIFPLLLLILFSSCGDKKSGISEITESPEVNSPQKTNTENFETFTAHLKEIALPVTIEIDEDNSESVELTEQQVKDFAPLDCDNQACRIFAEAKIKTDDLTGVFYLYKYQLNDLEFNEELSFEIYLCLYDENGIRIDDLLLAVQNYGNGNTYIKSWNEIMYFFEAEMEFITLIITTYSLEGGKFKHIKMEEKTFDSSESGYEAYLDYLNTIKK